MTDGLENSEKKKLPTVVGKEIWLNPRYAIARSMGRQFAFKTLDNQPMICTLKKIQENYAGLQVQFHLRFEGRDSETNVEDVLDIDVYIPFQEFQRLVREASSSW